MPDQFLYPADLKQATHIQRELATRVIVEDTRASATPFRWVAGADISHIGRNQKAPLYGALALLDRQSATTTAIATYHARPVFPYVPGYLGFREIPILVEGYRRLNHIPDLIMVDGHGISHPRGLGIASHLGVILDITTIGVAKTILVGSIEGNLGPRKGDRAPLIWQGKVIGMAIRTKINCRPLYISVGHRISLESAVDQVFSWVNTYRIPEPIRQAHINANKARLAG